MKTSTDEEQCRHLNSNKKQFSAWRTSRGCNKTSFTPHPGIQRLLGGSGW